LVVINAGGNASVDKLDVFDPNMSTPLVVGRAIIQSDDFNLLGKHDDRLCLV
jgi:hypothetical protein